MTGSLKIRNALAGPLPGLNSIVHPILCCNAASSTACINAVHPLQVTLFWLSFVEEDVREALYFDKKKPQAFKISEIRPQSG